MHDDPRGPFKKVISITSTPQRHLVKLSCGHIAHINRHFMAPKVGADLRCFDCGPRSKQAKAKMRLMEGSTENWSENYDTLNKIR